MHLSPQTAVHSVLKHSAVVLVDLDKAQRDIRGQVFCSRCSLFSLKVLKSVSVTHFMSDVLNASLRSVLMPSLSRVIKHVTPTFSVGDALTLLCEQNE